MGHLPVVRAELLTHGVGHLELQGGGDREYPLVAYGLVAAVAPVSVHPRVVALSHGFNPKPLTPKRSEMGDPPFVRAEHVSHVVGDLKLQGGGAHEHRLMGDGLVGVVSRDVGPHRVRI